MFSYSMRDTGGMYTHGNWPIVPMKINAFKWEVQTSQGFTYWVPQKYQFAFYKELSPGGILLMFSDICISSIYETMC